MKKIMKKIWDLLLYFGYVHEIFHYAAARLMGVRAELHKTYVICDVHISNTKRNIITLAPLFVFTLTFIAVLFAWHNIVDKEI